MGISLSLRKISENTVSFLPKGSILRILRIITCPKGVPPSTKQLGACPTCMTMPSGQQPPGFLKFPKHPFLGVFSNHLKALPEIWSCCLTHPLPVVEDVVRLLLLDTLVVLELVLRLVLLVLLLVPDVDVVVALVEEVAWRNKVLFRNVSETGHPAETRKSGKNCNASWLADFLSGSSQNKISQSGTTHPIVWIWITHGRWSHLIFGDQWL